MCKMEERRFFVLERAKKWKNVGSSSPEWHTVLDYVEAMGGLKWRGGRGRRSGRRRLSARPPTSERSPAAKRHRADLPKVRKETPKFKIFPRLSKRRWRTKKTLRRLGLG